MLFLTIKFAGAVAAGYALMALVRRGQVGLYYALSNFDLQTDSAHSPRGFPLQAPRPQNYHRGFFWLRVRRFFWGFFRG